jgi:hypothetical protein
LLTETSLCRQWNKNKAKKQAADWELETRRQHQLMAEELFPAHASEQVHAIQLGKKVGGRWLNKAHKRMEKKKLSLRTRDDGDPGAMLTPARRSQASPQ